VYVYLERRFGEASAKLIWRAKKEGEKEGRGGTKHVKSAYVSTCWYVFMFLYVYIIYIIYTRIYTYICKYM